jgi:hypothetical protein
MQKVSVWKCPEHGEIEFLDYTEPVAYCPKCGKSMEKVGEYDEKS